MICMTGGRSKVLEPRPEVGLLTPIPLYYRVLVLHQGIPKFKNRATEEGNDYYKSKNSGYIQGGGEGCELDGLHKVFHNEGVLPLPL